MFSSFKKNKRYLNQYYLTVIGLLLAVDGAVYFLRYPDWQSLVLFAPVFVLLAIPNIYLATLAWIYSVSVCLFLASFDLVYLLGIPAAIVITFTATALLHNASHTSYKPRSLSRPFGELMALWQVVGFPDWTVVHVLHHMNSDDPELDPHPPLDKGYWKFMLEMRQSITKVLGGHYFKLWGNTEDSLRNLKELGLLAKIASFLKVIFWFLVLEPQLFTFLFVSSVVFKMLHYAWFNYATHVHTPEGTLIVNLDQGFYKFINFVAFGLYYHKNHHHRAGLFNPSKL